MSKEQLANDLESLRNAVQTQLGQTHPPRTTLEIIDKPTEEAFWERFLVYFIDPSEPHGFGTEVLEAFLQALAEAPESSVPDVRVGLQDIQIQTQVAADDGNPDILLWKDEDWFILIEMKVGSAESNDQTRRYANSQKFGSLEVGNYPREDRYYIYLTEPSGKPPVAVETFEQVRWNHILEYLETVVEDDRRKYPAKSRFQYIDFLDTIKTEFNMTEYDADLHERAALAIEYGEVIDTVTSGLEQLQDRELSRWQTDFHDTLGQNESSWRTTEFGSFLVVSHENWTVNQETLTIDSEQGDIVAGYIGDFTTDNMKRRNIQADFKIFQKWVNNSFANKIDTHFEKQREQLKPYIEQDISMRLRDDTKSALFVRDVEYDITEAHSVGERLAHAVEETDNNLHERVTALLKEALDGLQD